MECQAEIIIIHIHLRQKYAVARNSVDNGYSEIGCPCFLRSSNQRGKYPFKKGYNQDIFYPLY
jgi:hypothetical protein